jgi:hypothetical protein
MACRLSITFSYCKFHFQRIIELSLTDFGVINFERAADHYEFVPGE